MWIDMNMRIKEIIISHLLEHDQNNVTANLHETMDINQDIHDIDRNIQSFRMNRYDTNGNPPSRATDVTTVPMK